MASILVEIKGTAKEFVSSMKEAEGEVKKLGTEGAGHLEKLKTVGKAAFLGIAGGAVALGVAAFELGDKLEASQTRLEGAIANTGGSFDKLRPQIDNANKSMAIYGFSSADTESALATLTNATRSPTKALSDLSLAADIAKGRNMDLGSATMLLAKVQTGHMTALSRLGLATKDVTGKTLTQKQAIAELTKIYGGDAQRSADTLGGKITTLKTQLENEAASIGMKLMPALSKLLSMTESVVQWFQKHTTVAKVLAATLGGALLVAIGAYVAGLVASAAATVGVAVAAVTAAGGLGAYATALSIVIAEQLLALAPVIAIIAGVALLGVGIYELATHWSTVWNGIKTVVGNVVAFMIGLFKRWVDVTLDVFGAIVNGAAHAFGWIPGLGPKLKAAAATFNSFRAAVDTQLNAAAAAAGNWGAKAGANYGQQFARNALSVIATVKAAGGSVQAQKQAAAQSNKALSYRAAGGPVSRGSTYIVGEQGPEVFIPGSSGTIIPNGGGGSPAGTAGGAPLVVQVVLDGRVIAESTQKHLLQRKADGARIGLG